jgi:hypothetical protein
MSATQSTFGSPGPELTLDQVVGDPDTGNAQRRAPTLLCHQAADASLAHQPLDAFARHHNAAAESQLGLHAASAVNAPGAIVDLLDLFDRPRVGEVTVRRRPAFPLVEGRARNRQQLAEAGDREAGLSAAIIR